MYYSYYLLANNQFPLLRAATEKMWDRPQAIAKSIMTRFKERVPAPRVLVVGVGFKKGQALLTHSPAVGLVESLQELGAKVTFVDPLVSQEMLPFFNRLDENKEWSKEHLELNFDHIVVAVKQDLLDYSLLQQVAVPVQTFVQ
jgi:UDP-N-acetyl-D-mannosaminuronate dehydrogenase